MPFFALCVRADVSSFFIRNFSHRDYGASCQNWGAVAGPDSFLYIANNTGLLVFDGNSWGIHETPDQAAVLSVTVYRDTVFTGHTNDFGYWVPRSDGTYVYRSLLKAAGPLRLHNESFRTLMATGEALWIGSEHVCYRYSEGRLESVPLPEAPCTEWLAGGDGLYVWAAGNGVFRVDGGGFVRLPEFDPLKDERLTFIHAAADGGYLAGTERRGLLRLADGECRSWDVPAASALQQVQISAFEEAGGFFLVGTQRDGLYVLDAGGALRHHYNLENRLQDNHIRAIYRQNDGSAWLALDNGVSRLLLSSPVVLLEERSKVGKLLDGVADSSFVWVRTGQGVFRLSRNAGGESCAVPADRFPDSGESRVHDILAALAPEEADTLLPFRTVFMENDRILWGLQEDNRIFRLRLSSQSEEVESIKEYELASGGRIADLAFVDGFVVAFTGRGCWRYTRLNDCFVPYTELDEQLGGYAAGNAVFRAGDDSYWVLVGNEAALFHIKDGDSRLQCRILFDDYDLNMVTREKRIVPLADSLFLVSAMQGIVLLNTNRLAAVAGTPDGSFRVRQIAYVDDTGRHVVAADTPVIRLPHDFRHLEIRAATSVFVSAHPVSYRIKGISSSWSAWQLPGDISFFQLPVGEYELEIRKYAAVGPFPQVSLRLEVAAPWYDTLWAYIAYLLLLWGIGQTGLHYYLKHQRRQEQSLAAAGQAAEEQRVQQLKNEMLLAELQNKNNELTLQTSALVKRNQVMQSLLDELERQKQALGDRYPNKLYSRMRQLIEENINNQADWVLFESYFNSAHRDFTGRLRAAYPDLTAGDFRICCLLRMNLSTKEIASLLNISVRSVELRRYRLRKRLSLDGDANLVDFLVSF